MNTSLIAKLLSWAFSFENIFVLFLIAGRIKADPRFAKLPVDMTLLFFIGGTLSYFYLFVRERKYRKLNTKTLVPISVYFLFIAWIVFSLLWTPYTNYTINKVLRIMIFVTWSFIAPILIITKEKSRIQRFFVLWLIYAIWISLESWSVYLSSGVIATHQILGSNYLGVGRVAGFALIIVASYLWFTRSVKPTQKMLVAMGVIFFIFTLLIIGARGPFLAAVLTLMVLPLLKMNFVRIVKFVYFSAFVALLLVFLSPHAPTVTIKRLGVILQEEGGGTSVEGRLYRYKKALELTSEHPVGGGGISSFYYYYGDHSKPRDYPHNIFLETSSELGVIGLAILIVLLVYPVVCIHKYKDNYSMTFYLLFIYNLLNALVSGDISDNRMLFMSIGFIVGYVHNHDRYKREARP